MSKTALLDALKTFDVGKVQSILGGQPALRELRSDKGFDLLQMTASRSTADDPAAAERQLELARWLVSQGFDPMVTHTTKPGEDGEQDPAVLSLVFFAVARAQNNALVRYFLDLGVKAEGLFAAAWWGNWEILEDLVTRGANVNEFVGATPLHMAVGVLDRGVAGKPALAKRRLRTLHEFLRLGADPNIAAVDRDTPLHATLRKGYDVSVFSMLLDYGANPDVPGREGRTVRDIASRKRDKTYLYAVERRARSR
ncbi:MAG TPA: ankyrin repeat domain-containing protein [Vicinamibacterales bacterium]|nr:ankyrin repeat domain-containing protein [Vicinamibacterales bacterium]